MRRELDQDEQRSDGAVAARGFLRLPRRPRRPGGVPVLLDDGDLLQGRGADAEPRQHVLAQPLRHRQLPSPPRQDRVHHLVRQQRARLRQQHAAGHRHWHHRGLRAGPPQVPRSCLHVERGPHHLPGATRHSLHPALRADPHPRPGRQPRWPHRRLSVLHDSVRDLAPHGLLRVHPRGARGSGHDRRSDALRRLQACDPAPGRPRSARGKPLRLHPGLERVPLRAGLHHRRAAAHSARGPLHLHHGRRVRVGVSHGGSGADRGEREGLSDFPGDLTMIPGAGTPDRLFHGPERIACDTAVRAISALLILLASVLMLAWPEPVRAVTLRDPTLRVDLLVSGLSSPTTMAFIGPNDLLVLQKNDGRVRRVTYGGLQPNAVLDLAVDFASERGLLGIAVHPNFPTTPFVYLFFTESSTGGDTAGSPPPLGNRLYQYTWNGSSLVSPVLLLSLPATAGPNHNGGVILFGPDGKLYIVIGDLNRNGQLQNIATGPAPDDSGVILRLNEDGSVPLDNPFAALGGNLAKYYAYGIRNSFGMAFDPVTGKLWMTENGPDVYDEINLVEPGFNSGWNRIMGPAARSAQGTSNLVFFPGSHYEDPKFSWLDTVAPTGIVFLSSSALGAAYTNHVFVGDINAGVLYHFVPNSARNGFVFNGAGLGDLVADSPTELDETIFGTGFDGIVDLKVGPDGRLYVLSFSGLIFVISSATPAAASLTVTQGTVTAGGGTDVAWTGMAIPTPTDWIG